MWDITVRFPYRPEAISKNRKWGIDPRSGRMYSRSHNTAQHREVAVLLRQEINKQNITPQEGVLYFSIHIRKKDHRSDALNVLDLVADAIQDATGVDDRWYMLVGVTWQIAEDGNPTMDIRLMQLTDEAQRICPRCKRVLGLSMFTTKTGMCKGCKRGR